jgi:hypothetical protein
VLGEPILCALLNARGEWGIGLAQGFHAGAEACGVERVDGESSVAALRAAWLAGEMRAGDAGDAGEFGVHDLDELGVARGEGHEFRIRAG